MEADKNHYKSAAAKCSLLFATIGLLSALLFLALLDGLSLIGYFPKSIMTAVVALYFAAAYFGSVAGSLIYESRGAGLGVWLTGIGLAWLCLGISVLAGSSVEFLSTNRSFEDFGDYIFQPLMWVLLVGIIPAFVLGLLYTATVKKYLK